MKYEISSRRLAEINLVLHLFGYPLFITVISAFVGISDTQIYTVPFRAFTLGVSIVVIVISVKKEISVSKELLVFLVLWSILLLRIFVDLEVQTQFYITEMWKGRIWLFVVGLIMIPGLSILLSVNKIRFEKVINDLCVLGWVFLVFAISNSVVDASRYERLDANIGLVSINFSRASALIGLAFFVKGAYCEIEYRKKILYYLLGVIAFYVTLRTGSRGPLIALVLVLMYWLYMLSDNFLFRGIIIFISGLFVFFGKEILISLIDLASPITAHRINLALIGEDLSANSRVETYFWFLDKIIDSPFIGSHFAKFSSYGVPYYAHNIFLDVLLATGVVGFLLLVYLLYMMLRKNSMAFRESRYYDYSFGLLFMLLFAVLLFSDAYYLNPEFNLLFLLLLSKKEEKNEKGLSSL